MSGAAPPIPLAEAQARLLELAMTLPVETVAAENAIGRYLAVPLTAARTQPPASLSAMDGFALKAPALRGPWQVIGESAAGHPFPGPIKAGEAVRISTGAILPDGADTILLQEDAQREGDRLELSGAPPEPGRHIRLAGFDFVSGEELLPAGARLSPPALALALGAGHATLRVARKPVVAIIDSGDELAADPTNCSPHEIPASNGAMLCAMARALPCEILRIGPVPDDPEALAAALARAESADIVVTSGGASVGDHDLVRPALERWGAEIAFWRVAMKPGKPLMVAKRGRQLVLGLPGNPVSSFVTALLFMMPLLRAMLGAGDPLPRAVLSRSATSLPPGGQRLEFLRARWDGSTVRPVAEQDSSALRALACSNALIERSIGAPRIEAGTYVPIYLFENGGNA